ncbi:MAG: hypothetical protein AAF456_23520 [Planctomycetota bacterium]
MSERAKRIWGIDLLALLNVLGVAAAVWLSIYGSAAERTAAIVLGIVCAISAVGIFKRLNAVRIPFMVLLSVAIAWGLLILAFAIAALTGIGAKSGADVELFKVAAAPVGMGLALWILMYLRRTDVQEDFRSNLETKIHFVRQVGIATAVLGVSFGTGLFVNHLYDSAQEKRIVEELQAGGADVRFETGGGSKTTRSLFGRYFFDKVVEVRINDEEFDDLTDIQFLRDLEILRIDDTSVRNLGPISELWNLKVLSINDTPVRDLIAVENLLDLEEVHAEGTEIRNLDPLINLNLKTLRCSRTNVGDLAPVSNMEELNDLRFSYTMVQDLRPLEKVNMLTIIHLDHTHVWDLRPLEESKRLSEVVFDGAPLLPSMVARLDLELPNWTYGKSYEEVRR